MRVAPHLIPLTGQRRGQQFVHPADLAGEELRHQLPVFFQGQHFRHFFYHRHVQQGRQHGGLGALLRSGFIAELTLQHGLEIFHVQRLGQKIIQPAGQGFIPRFRENIGRQSDDLHARRHRTLAQMSCRFDAVHRRHVQIHQDQIERLPSCRLYRFRAVLNHGDEMPLFLQHRLHVFAIDRVVVHNQNAQLTSQLRRIRLPPRLDPSFRRTHRL